MNLGVAPEDIFLCSGVPSASPDLNYPLDPDTSCAITILASPYMASGISVRAQKGNLGPYCSAAESVSLLGQVLEFISRTSFENAIDFEKYAMLDRALQSIALVLLQKATKGWHECCAPIGICFR